jgi:hypothetical protein
MVPSMDNTEWQVRAKAAGLTQLMLAQLLGLTPTGVSQGIRGKWESGVPQNIRATVIAWELMTPEQRAEWVRLASGGSD